MMGQTDGQTDGRTDGQTDGLGSFIDPALHAVTTIARHTQTGT